MVIEVADVDAVYRRVVAAGLPIQHELANNAWGHRSFCVQEPNGITLYLYSGRQP